MVDTYRDSESVGRTVYWMCTQGHSYVLQGEFEMEGAEDWPSVPEGTDGQGITVSRSLHAKIRFGSYRCEKCGETTSRRL